MSNKKAALSPLSLKDSECWPGSGFEPATSRTRHRPVVGINWMSLFQMQTRHPNTAFEANQHVPYCFVLFFFFGQRCCEHLHGPSCRGYRGYRGCRGYSQNWALRNMNSVYCNCKPLHNTFQIFAVWREYDILTSRTHSSKLYRLQLPEEISTWPPMSIRSPCPANRGCWSKCISQMKVSWYTPKLLSPLNKTICYS